MTALQADDTRRRSRARGPALAPAALAGVTCALALAACGGGNGNGGGAVGGTTATGDASPLALSECMRANGVPKFPDPDQGSGGLGFSGGLMRGSDGGLTVDGIAFNGPALRTAEKACARYLIPKGPPPQLTSRQEAGQLALAECMRKHGVPNFPDPGSGGGGPTVDSNSPAYQSAANACGGAGSR